MTFELSEFKRTKFGQVESKLSLMNLPLKYTEFFFAVVFFLVLMFYFLYFYKNIYFAWIYFFVSKFKKKLFY